MSDSDRSGRPSRPSFRDRLRISFREDPTKGVFLLALVLLAFGFLAAGIVAFWEPILEWLVGLLS